MLQTNAPEWNFKELWTRCVKQEKWGNYSPLFYFNNLLTTYAE